jgi:uncharacterized protein (TIGR02145 family)
MKLTKTSQRLICFFSLFLIQLQICILANAQDKGHIQIQCADGIQIFLDGRLQGVSSSDVGGLVKQDVSVGKHVIKAVKQGFEPQEKAITLGKDQVLLVSFLSLIPAIIIKEEGKKDTSAIEKKVGTIVLQSLPIQCTIDIPLARIQSASKSKDKWTADQVPEGIYPTLVKGYGKELNFNLQILAKETTFVMVNLLTNKVDTQITSYGLMKGAYSSKGIEGKVTDIDGNVYQTVTIGTQVWMAENLKVTHYRNGEAIPNITNATTWSGLTTGAYCEYNNDINNVATYGRLYNWYSAVDSRNIAPAGWHVPSDAEWQTLVDYLGGSSVAGGKMKEAGTTHWFSPNTGATNESGFSGLPGGYRVSSGTYYSIGYLAHFWSSTEYNSSSAWFRYLYYDGSEVARLYYNKRDGFSVRCVRDY